MIRAVICDDEKAALNIIGFYIENAHLPIEIVGTAENGRDALNLIKNKKPDIVFMDIQMPYMDGFEVISQLNASKIIVITAYDSFAYAQKALRLGVCDIISKPIDIQQLNEAIERTIGWKFTENKDVNAAIEYIHRNYAKQISMEELASHILCSQSHISRQFKKYMGCSILSYIHDVRINKALCFINEKKYSIQEIAEMTGYQNLNNFYKYFKQYTGMTPAAYMTGGLNDGKRNSEEADE